MSMTPIDLKAAIGSAYEVGRAGGADSSRAGMQQAYFGRQLDKEINHAEQFVRESDRAGATQPDGRNARGRFGEKGKDKKKNLEASEELAEFKESSTVDIRV